MLLLLWSFSSISEGEVNREVRTLLIGTNMEGESEDGMSRFSKV
jgi:hypothetical protein